jgi:3-dehydroquinate dehydratase II
MPTIAVVNGPNLNLLGTRETEIYGTTSIDDINEKLTSKAEELGFDIEFFQSNHEGALIDYIQGSIGRIQGLIINPGALTHYGYSLRDALASINIPIIEVHITNIFRREEWRSISLVTPLAAGSLMGLGGLGYDLALRAMVSFIEEKE